MALFKNRAKTLLNIIDDSFFIHCQTEQLKEKQSQISLSKVQITLVEKFLKQLPKDIWIKEKININLNNFLTDNKISLKDLGIPLRIILTGSKNAPGIIDSDDGTKDFKILEFTTSKNQNLLENLERGAYCSHRIYLNPLTFEYTAASQRIFKLDDYSGKIENLGADIDVVLPSLSDKDSRTLA